MKFEISLFLKFFGTSVCTSLVTHVKCKIIHGLVKPGTKTTFGSFIVVQESWEERWRLSTGSLLAAGCEGAMLVANCPEEVQVAAR